MVWNRTYSLVYPGGTATSLGKQSFHERCLQSRPSLVTKCRGRTQVQGPHINICVFDGFHHFQPLLPVKQSLCKVNSEQYQEGFTQMAYAESFVDTRMKKEGATSSSSYSSKLCEGEKNCFWALFYWPGAVQTTRLYFLVCIGTSLSP